MLFQKQDSIGVKPYVEYAQEAGIAEIGKFRRCATSTEVVTSIESGIADARALGATGTPTLIINGLKVSGISDPTRFVSYIEQALEEGR